MSAVETFVQIERRRISLTPALGLWVASVDEFGDTTTTERRKVRSISATASTPIGAVEALITKLDRVEQQQSWENRE